jgi:RNase H-fold protein (predicted Holliday junction resolvase)
LPVELAEERLSSWEAEALLRSGPLARRKRKAGVDDVAAAVILRDYLARAAAEDPFAR